MRKILHSLMALTVIFAGAAVVRAQAPQPVLVVSLPSVNDLLADVEFLGQLGGQPMAKPMADGMLNSVKGLDRTKPIGLIVSIDANNKPNPVLLIPVSSAKDLVTSISMFGLVGPPTEENGVLRTNSPQGDLFVREQNGWAVVSHNQDTQPPADPMKALAGLNADYDIGVRVYLQNVPAKMRKDGIDQIRNVMAFAAAMQQQQGQGLGGLSQQSMDQQIQAIERLLNEADQITIGWKLDRQVKNTHLDVTFTAVPGSTLAKDLQTAADVRTNFAGFNQSDSAVTMNFTGKSSPEQIQQAMTTLEQLKTKAEEAVDKDQNLPDDNARAQVKTVLRQLLDVIEKTVQTGKSDAGAIVVCGPNKFQAVLGGFVADTAGLESAVKNLITLAKGDAEFNSMATVKMDLENYKDVKFHQISVKLPESEDDARKVFGDSVDVYFGAGHDGAYVALGKGSLDLAKAVIDKSAAEPNKSVLPFQLSVALAPIFSFASSLHNDDDVAGFASALQSTQGKDHILLTAKPISNGITYRLQVEEGILQAAGEMSKKKMMRGQGGGAQAPNTFRPGG